MLWGQGILEILGAIIRKKCAGGWMDMLWWAVIWLGFLFFSFFFFLSFFLGEMKKAWLVSISAYRKASIEWNKELCVDSSTRAV